MVELIAKVGVWFITKLIQNNEKREEAKKKFLNYVSYWEGKREKSEDISSDVDWLNQKMDEYEKNNQKKDQ